jgi:hypothetical protein
MPGRFRLGDFGADGDGEQDRMNEQDRYQLYLEVCESSGIPSSVAEWIFDRIFQKWKWECSATHTTACLDESDWLSYVRQACIALWRFRPSREDLAEAIKPNSLKTILDVARAITLLQKTSSASCIDKLTPNSLLPPTNEVWQTLLKLPSDEYNDQFAVKCFISRHFLSQAAKAQSSGGVRTFAARAGFWSPRFFSFDAEKILLAHKFQKIIHNASMSADGNPGDVVHFQIVDAVDPFNLFALVAKSKDSNSSFEFKPEGEAPLRATAQGIRAFFSGDAPRVRCSHWNKVG